MSIREPAPRNPFGCNGGVWREGEWISIIMGSTDPSFYLDRQSERATASDHGVRGSKGGAKGTTPPLGSEAVHIRCR